MEKPCLKNKNKNKFWELDLSFHHGFWGWYSGCQACVAKCFNPTNHPALGECLYMSVLILLLVVGKIKFLREAFGSQMPEVFVSEVLTGWGTGFLGLVASSQALLTILPLS